MNYFVMKLQLLTSLRYLFLALAFCVVHVYAQTTTVNGMTFRVGAGNTASLTKVGTTATTLVVPRTVTISGTEYPVTNVARGAFSGDKRITSITFSEGLKTIDERAIENCTKLTTINLPSTLESWNHSLYKCGQMKTYNVAAGNPYYSSFNGFLYDANQTKLIAAPRRQLTVTFPATVTEIGDYAFEYTYAASIVLPGTITKIGKYAFAETSQITTMTLPAALTSLGEGAFYMCSGLTSINVAAGNLFFSTIDNVLYDFEKKNLLFVPVKRTAALELPSSVTAIAPNAAYLSSISGITFPEGLKTIGASAFYACRHLGVLNFPSTLTEIGFNAFSNAGISAYNVASGNPVYSSQDGVLYNANKTTLLRYPTTSTSDLPVLPNTLKRIETNAFTSTQVGGKLIVPAGVTELGDGAFGNTALESIILPEGITELPYNLFSASTLLKTIVIPGSVTSIGTNVFSSCESLTDLEYRGKDMPTLGTTISSAVTVHAREDATFTDKNWGMYVVLEKDLAVLPLNMTSYRYATFHWSDKNYAIPAGLRAATLHLDGSGVECRFSFKTGDVVSADVALLMNGNEGNYEMVETKFAPASNIDVNGNVLFGRATEDRYNAQNGRVYALTTKDGVLGFYWQKDTDGTYAITKLNRGYIDVNVGAGTQGFSLDGNFLTGLQNIATPETLQTPIYDLGGRKVQTPARGLYIVKGKKVIF